MHSKVIPWHQVVVKESTGFFARCPVWGQAKRRSSSWSKDPNSLMERVFKGKVRISGCLISLWTSFWLTGGEETGWYLRVNIIIFQVQPVWVLCAGGQQLTSSTYCKFQCRQDGSRIWLGILSVALEEELKALDFVLWLNYYFVLLDWFPLFLHFLTALIKSALWNLEKAKTFL